MDRGDFPLETLREHFRSGLLAGAIDVVSPKSQKLW